MISGSEFRGGPLNGQFADGIQLTRASADIIGNKFMEVGRLAVGTFPQAASEPKRTSTIRFVNNLFVDEDAFPHIQLVSSMNTNNQISMVNNTIVDGINGIGIGLFDGQGQVTLANTIVVSFLGEDDLFAYNGSDTNQLSRISIHHCLIGGDRTFNSAGNNNNITGDPRFVDVSRENYQLRPGSPAIDTGDDMAIQGFMTDLANNPRIANGDGLGMATVDIGALERQP